MRDASLRICCLGHVKTMAMSLKEGIEAAGCEAVLLQVAETLPDEVLGKMHAPPKDADIPVATAADFLNCDGILFGMPTRFGMAPAQMKTLMDSTGGHWFSGALVGKPAGMFFSTGVPGGGQETTGLTWITQLAHHGMVYVPLGYSTPLMMDISTVKGGSAYGPGQPSKEELEICVHYGKFFSGTADALKKGRAAQNA